MKLELKLTGQPIVKKNSKRMVAFWRGGKQLKALVPSLMFEKFKTSALSQIADQLGAIPSRPMFNGVIKVTTTFYIPGKARVDADNLHTSILDILQDAKIIKDDNNVIAGRYNKYWHCPDWGTHIIIDNLIN